MVRRLEEGEGSDWRRSLPALGAASTTTYFLVYGHEEGLPLLRRGECAGGVLIFM